MHPPPHTPVGRRHSDPHGKAARLSAALQPWVPIIAVVCFLWAVGVTVFLFVGARVISPSDELAGLRHDLTALQQEVQQLRADNDATQRWSIALAKSKCLELDDDSRALSVLPCDNLRRMPPFPDDEGAEKPAPGNAQRQSDHTDRRGRLRRPSAETVLLATLPIVLRQPRVQPWLPTDTTDTADTAAAGPAAPVLGLAMAGIGLVAPLGLDAVPDVLPWAVQPTRTPRVWRALQTLVITLALFVLIAALCDGVTWIARRLLRRRRGSRGSPHSDQEPPRGPLPPAA